MIKSRLLSVAHAHAECEAGIPGQCSINVRVLDDVSLRVYAGELLLVHVPERLGRTMLLSVLAGSTSPTRRYIQVVRDVAQGVRIRRAAVNTQLIAEIVHGWQDAAARRDASAERAASADRARSAATPTPKPTPTPTLYLLRATRSACTTARDAHEWRRWARAARARGDGVVLACPTSTRDQLAASRSTAYNDSMREPSARYELENDARYLSPHDAAHDSPRDAQYATSIRALELRAGRLHDVRTPRVDHAVRSTTAAAEITSLTAVPTRHQW